MQDTTKAHVRLKEDKRGKDKSWKEILKRCKIKKWEEWEETL